MQRYTWSRLNKQQVGAYTEYFVKMELTMYGFQVYGTEVDDRGIDFVARHDRGPFIEVQVKSLRPIGYVFMQKDKFTLREHLYLALGLLSKCKFVLLITPDDGSPRHGRPGPSRMHLSALETSASG